MDSIIGDPLVRWMIRRDMGDVLAIERLCFEHPWTDEDFFDALRQRNCVGAVEEDGDVIRGFVLYKLGREQLEILNIAVHPDHRHLGIGRRMVKNLQDKLRPNRRKVLCITVKESNLPAHLFFQSLGFIAVIQGRHDANEAAYRFLFREGWGD